MLDKMAARYGCRPSELVNSSMDDLLIDFRSYRAHLAELRSAFQRARADREPIQKTYQVGSI